MTRLRAEDAMLVLVDCQAGPLGMVRTMHETALAAALASLARIATVLGMPVVLATAPVQGNAGEVVPELRLVMAGATRIVRCHASLWEEQAFRDGLAASGRNTVVFAGVGTDVAVALPALAASEAGHPCAVAVDACGAISDVAERAAWLRLAGAGVALASWTGLAVELAGSLVGQPSKAAHAIVREHFALLPHYTSLHRE